MLSFVLRRTILRPVTLLSARGLPCAISPNRPLTWPVKRGFATTSGDLDSGSTADSELESSPKSPGRKTGSGKKVARKDKTEGKTSEEAPVKPKITIKAEDCPPKRPVTPFVLWLSEWIRAQPKADGPLAPRDYFRQGAQAWHTVSEHDKLRYKEKSESLMTEYKRRMAEWHEKTNPAVFRELNRHRATKGLPRIRRPSGDRPLSSFFRYLQEVRGNAPRTQEQDHVKVLAKHAGEQWRAMSEAEKAKYNDPARAEFATWREKRKVAGDAK